MRALLIAALVVVTGALWFSFSRPPADAPNLTTFEAQYHSWSPDMSHAPASFTFGRQRFIVTAWTNALGPCEAPDGPAQHRYEAAFRHWRQAQSAAQQHAPPLGWCYRAHAWILEQQLHKPLTAHIASGMLVTNDVESLLASGTLGSRPVFTGR